MLPYVDEKPKKMSRVLRSHASAVLNVGSIGNQLCSNIKACLSNLILDRFLFCASSIGFLRLINSDC